MNGISPFLIQSLPGLFNFNFIMLNQYNVKPIVCQCPFQGTQCINGLISDFSQFLFLFASDINLVYQDGFVSGSNVDKYYEFIGVGRGGRGGGRVGGGGARSPPII